MTLQNLDQIFPYFVFLYGILMIFVLENEVLDKLAREKMPAIAQTMRGHRALAWVCFFAGGLWSLQNIWLI